MTTICSVRFNGQTAIAGDGQVTLGEKVIAKATARKIRRIYHDRVVIGFAGGVADAVSLQEMLEGKLESYSGDLRRAAVEMAQDWRKDPALQKLNAMLIAFNDKDLLLISGNGEVLEPDENVVAIGSGGNFAQAAAIAMTRHAKDMKADEIAHEAVKIASGIDVFTDDQIITWISVLRMIPLQNMPPRLSRLLEDVTCCPGESCMWEGSPDKKYDCNLKIFL